jgi:hypothetical protein
MMNSRAWRDELARDLESQVGEATLTLCGGFLSHETEAGTPG